MLKRLLKVIAVPTVFTVGLVPIVVIGGIIYIFNKDISPDTILSDFIEWVQKP